MSPKTRRIIWIVLGIVLAVAAYQLRVYEDLHDYEVDHRAGQRLLAGEDLYRTDDGHYVYKYPPGAAVLEMPLSLLPLSVARIVHYAAILIAMIVMLRLSYALLPDNQPKPKWLMPLTFFILVKYFAREIDLGQINMIIAMLMLLMVDRLRRVETNGATRDADIGGVFWGMATTLKPHGLVFLPYFVITRQWRALGAGLGTIAALAVVPTVFYGVSGNLAQHADWYRTLTDSSPVHLTNPNNTSLIGFLARTTGDPELSLYLWLAGIAVLSIGVLIVVLRGRAVVHPVVLDAALLMTLIPIVSPLGWDYIFLMSSPGVMLLVQQRKTFNPMARWGLYLNLGIIMFFITDVVGHRAHEIYTDWTLTTVNFLIVAGYLCALRLRGTA